MFSWSSSSKSCSSTTNNYNISNIFSVSFFDFWSWNSFSKFSYISSSCFHCISNSSKNSSAAHSSSCYCIYTKALFLQYHCWYSFNCHTWYKWRLFVRKNFYILYSILWHSYFYLYFSPITSSFPFIASWLIRKWKGWKNHHKYN